MMHGEYGIDDVCLSTLVSVGREGITGQILVPLSAEEKELLKKSADSLKAVISSISLD